MEDDHMNFKKPLSLLLIAALVGGSIPTNGTVYLISNVTQKSKIKELERKIENYDHKENLSGLASVGFFFFSLLCGNARRIMYENYLALCEATKKELAEALKNIDIKNIEDLPKNAIPADLLNPTTSKMLQTIEIGIAAAVLATVTGVSMTAYYAFKSYNAYTKKEAAQKELATLS